MQNLLRLTFAALAVALFCSPASAQGKWVQLFDGKSLDGWEGNTGLWSVKNGAIVGSSKPKGLKRNTFLSTAKEYENYILRLKFKFDGKGNSGIQFRSKRLEGGEVKGYQADIGKGYHGSIYDEKRRGMISKSREDWVLRFLKFGKWNTYVIKAIGNSLELSINGLVTARYTEKDDKIPRQGIIALQLHSGGPMEISFKDIQIQEVQPKKLLYVTKAAGFAHSSRPLSRKVIEKIGRDSGHFVATTTDDVDLITPAGLKDFDALAFYTTGDLKAFPLSKENRDAMIAWVKNGGAFIGFHSATDTYKDWQPYWEMIGGSFAGHPWHEEVTIDVEDPTHPSVRHLDTHWVIKDEIYQFRNYSRDRLHIILSLSPKTPNKGQDKSKPEAERDYPVAWCRDFGKGKVFYTSLGHREDVWTNPDYQTHVEGGILWTLGTPGYEGDATPGLPKSSTDFVPLFDGKTLSGWEKIGNCEWTMGEDGVLAGGGVQGHLFSPKEYTNFHYKADLKVGENSNSGMYFRTQMEKGVNWPRGMEAQVNSSHGDPVRTGSLYSYVKVFEQLVPTNGWGTQEIICNGEHIVIKVNGRVTVAGKFAYNGQKHFPKGRFAFQQHHKGSQVWYKNVVVRELPAKTK